MMLARTPVFARLLRSVGGLSAKWSVAPQMTETLQLQTLQVPIQTPVGLASPMRRNILGELLSDLAILQMQKKKKNALRKRRKRIGDKDIKCRNR